MVSLQGVKMGRPSYVNISIDADKNGKISGVRVGGEAVLAGEGTLYV
jgi:predicted PhzF superfamily epimerase YddE/YHI9